MNPLSHNEIPVLDHGIVRYVDHKGSDLAIVQAARVSFDADWRTGEDAGKDSKLIAYMMANGHTSPFEHVVFTFEIKAPIFIFRQWHRHRTWSFSEQSGRYAPMKDEFYLPDADKIGTQSASNRQARDLPVDSKADGWIREIMAASCKRSYDDYQRLLEAGVPRELARIVLPVATYSRMFATVDLHNLMHFLRLRMHKHAQWEIQQYAHVLHDIAALICPIAMEAFDASLEH